MSCSEMRVQSGRSGEFDELLVGAGRRCCMSMEGRVVVAISVSTVAAAGAAAEAAAAPPSVFQKGLI